MIMVIRAVGMSMAWFHGSAEWPTDAHFNRGVCIDRLSQVLALTRP